MKTTTRLLVSNLQPINGHDFKSKEEIEDAVFPLFGPLQSLFPGEGHRDLVDRCIAAKWITLKGENWHCELPELPIETPTEAPKEPEPPQSGNPKMDAIAAIMADDFKLAIKILSTLL